MESLRERDLRAVLDFLQRIYAARSVEAFAVAVAEGAKALIPCEMSTYNALDLRRGVARVHCEPFVVAPADGDEAFARYMHEHPILEYWAGRPDGPATKVSDLIGRRQWHRRAIYADFYRRLDTEHNLAVRIRAAGGQQIAVGLLRRRKDFSERDRAVLDLLQPHLRRAYDLVATAEAARCEAALARDALDALDAGVVMVDGAGRVLAMNHAAQRLLDRYVSVPGVAERLAAWAAAANALPPDPLVIDGDGRRLIVRLVARDGARALLLEDEVTSFGPEDLAALGLARREAEVLAWVAQGKTNPAIATILAISPRTVQHTLERIYRKLGVEGRTAAAARALAAARDRR